VVKIDGTSFGSITIDGKRYPHDVWVFTDGSIERRDRDHEFTLNELDLLLKGKPKIIVVGTGRYGCVRVDREAAELAVKHGVQVVDDITPNVIERYNEAVRAGRRVAGAFHVTC
jgi:hypothetical protein